MAKKQCFMGIGLAEQYRIFSSFGLHLRKLCLLANICVPNAIPTDPLPSIPAGIGGLCCAALLAKYGKRVTVCESHYLPGGAAHSFKVKGYTFDAGPSFHAGLTSPNSPNPLKQVSFSP